MNPRQRAIKPLLGFGPAGYILVAIFLALLIPTLMGIDLRYELQKLIIYIFGADAMLSATAYTMLFSTTVFGMGINLITACVGLVAFNIAPFRIKRQNQLAWFCLCAFWIAPTLILNNIIVHIFGHSTIYSGFTSIYLTMSLGTLGVLVAGGFAVYITRSKIVAISWATALVLDLLPIAMFYSSGFYALFDWPLIIPGNFGISTVEIFFYLCSSGSLLTWAIIERRKPAPPSNPCPNCAYDLAGLPQNIPCPECGQTPIDTAPSSAVVHAVGVNHDQKHDPPHPSSEG